MDPSTFDFAGYYREAARAARRPERTPEYWDARASSLSDRALDSEYVRQFVARMDFSGCSTLLDVGCGPGAVALAAAPRLAHVYGLDHSPAMLAAFEANARARGVAGATAILRSWDDDWTDLPACDIVVASRSTAVPDLEAALRKLHAMARRRVYITYPADGRLVADEARLAIGREAAPWPDYLCVVGILHHLGLHPTLDYLPGDNGLAACDDFDSFRARIERLVGGLADDEVASLAAYFAARGERAGLEPMRWARLSWEVAENPRLSPRRAGPARGASAS